MSWTMNIMIFTFGSVAVIILFSCLAIAKQAEKRCNVIFSTSGKASATTLVFGKVTPKEPMKLVSQMPETVLFSVTDRG